MEASINFQGDNNYRGFYAGTLLDLDNTRRSSASDSAFAPLVAGARASDRIKVGNTLMIEPETGFLIGAVGDDAGQTAPGTKKVEVFRPDGTKLSATDPNNLDEFVVLDDKGNIRCFVIRNPAPGEWSFTLKFEATTTAIHFYAHTIPSGDVVQTMVSTLESIVGNRRPRSDHGCTACKITFWTAGVVLVAALITLAVLATDGAALSMLSFVLGIEQSSAMALLRGLLFAGSTVGVGFVVANLCSWVGACVPDTPLAISLTQPVKGATVSQSVPLVASVSGSLDIVRYFADGLLVGESRMAPDYSVLWSPTAGRHVLVAQAFRNDGDPTRQFIAVSNEVKVRATSVGR